MIFEQNAVMQTVEFSSTFGIVNLVNFCLFLDYLTKIFRIEVCMCEFMNDEWIRIMKQAVMVYVRLHLSGSTRIVTAVKTEDVHR